MENNFLTSFKLRILVVLAFLITFLVVAGVLIFLRQNNGIGNNVSFPVPTRVPLNPTGAINPPKPTFNKADGVSISTTTPVTFDLQEGLSFPQQIPAIKVSHSLSNSGAEFAENLSFLESPIKLGNSLLWTKGQNQTLLLNPTSGFVQYMNTEPSPSSPNKLPVEQIEKIAREEIEKLKIKNVSLNSVEINGYESETGELLPALSLDNAIIYELLYTQTAQDIPLYYQLGTPAKFAVWITNAGKVQKIEYFNVTLDTIGLTTIHTLEEVKTLTQRGEATVVKLGEFEDPSLTVEAINITLVSLGYFDDKIKNILSPIFILSGKAKTSSGEKNILLYLPAF